MNSDTNTFPTRVQNFISNYNIKEIHLVVQSLIRSQCLKTMHSNHLYFVYVNREVLSPLTFGFQAPLKINIRISLDIGLYIHLLSYLSTKTRKGHVLSVKEKFMTPTFVHEKNVSSDAFTHTK